MSLSVNGKLERHENPNLRADWAPRVANFPAHSTTAASEIIDLMDGIKRPLDPWQKFVIRHGLGQNIDEELGELTWAAPTCGCWVPRQNGKGDVIMALELGWMFILNEPLIVHSAHEYKTAQESYLRIKGVVENEPELDKLVQRYWQANGEQGVELMKAGAGTRRVTGARLRFMSRTKSAGKGFSAGKLILDEAQELTELQMKAILFVMSAQANPQIWYFGTPPTEDTAWIYNIKKAGDRSAPGVAWFNTGIETIDLSDRSACEALRDPALLYSTNPSLGIVRSNGTGLRLAALEGELTTLGAGKTFAMDRCGMWLPPARSEGDFSIDPQVWAERKALPVPLSQLGDFAVAFHVNPRRTHATVTYAGMWEGKWRVGIISHKPGTAWLLAKLLEIKTKYNPIVFTVDARSETIIEELAGIGIKLSESVDMPKRSDLLLPQAPDVATAFGLIVDATNNDNLEHENQPPLNSAVSVPPRPLSGGSTFDHKRGIEVGPSVGAGLAMWAYRERIEKIKQDYNPLDFIH